MAKDMQFNATFNGPEGQVDMPYLLSPGPVTTSRRVKLAMLADYGTHDPEFIAITANVQSELLRFAGGLNDFETVLMQGPGMFAVEAALGSFAPQRRKKTLVLANGKHGQLAFQILQRIGRPAALLERNASVAFSSGDVDEALAADTDITHVWAVHCEASSGIVNPVAEIAALVKARGKTMMVDGIASFGALPIDVNSNIDVLVSTSGNCLESVPGISFVMVRKSMLVNAEGKAPSFSLDLFANWMGMQNNGQFRLTPSTHAILALHEALLQLEEEGGIGARHGRYCALSSEMQTRMLAMGFSAVIVDAQRNPIVHSYFEPRDMNFDTDRFFTSLRERGFLIAPGGLTDRHSFRVSIMGCTDLVLIERFSGAVIEVLRQMDIRELRPRA